MNQGKLVEVGKPAPALTHNGEFGHCWQIRSLSGPMHSMTRSGKKVMAEEALIPDAWLTPHRPTGLAKDEPEPAMTVDPKNVPMIGVS